jgi:hypothetical protein
VEGVEAAGSPGWVWTSWGRAQLSSLEGELPHTPAVALTRVKSAASHARPCKSELGGRRFAESQNPLLQ